MQPALDPSDKALVHAAMYVRMSTESQNYSTDHQRQKIQKFAAASGMRIVREFADEGKSGLDLKGRSGLTNLIKIVQDGLADFKVIIVYDVSRWGRFQDVDEAAYHEHTCRRAGIAVVYCEETFQNDGSPLASLLKAIKRTMAAEYSRELSEKVFEAQCNFIRLGFKQGGHAGFGLRRLAITADGVPRRVLEYKEAKGAVTDRVILVLGPEHEVAIVRRVYSLYLDDHFSEAAIARLLNTEGIASEFNRPWTQAMVNSLLTNVKYTGALVFNRRSCKLSTRREHNEHDEWIVNHGAIESLLPSALFQLAQDERTRRNRRYGKQELLQLLTECYARNGNITSKIIAADPALPDPQLFIRTFGSLVLAYEAALLPRNSLHQFVDTKRLLRASRLKMFRKALDLAVMGGAVALVGSKPFTLILNGCVRVHVAVATRRHPKRSRVNWKISPQIDTDFIVAARLDSSTGILLDYYLLPIGSFGGRPIYLKASNLGMYERFAFTSLDALFGQPSPQLNE